MPRRDAAPPHEDRRAVAADPDRSALGGYGERSGQHTSSGCRVTPGRSTTSAHSSSRVSTTTLQQIAGDGFNAIILLVPWAEIQPSLGPPAIYNEAALSRLQSLVASARAHDLQVILRVRIWSINPGQELPNIERITALLLRSGPCRILRRDPDHRSPRRATELQRAIRPGHVGGFLRVTALPDKTPEVSGSDSRCSHVSGTVRRS